MKLQLANYFQSASNNPWRNLAYEEYLLDHLRQDQVVLYLWQNERTVVIGANQNPFREVNIERLEQEGGKLARRLSGGGAVYHDLGNLNFTFIIPRNHYDFERQVGIIISAIKRLNIEVAFSGRNDLIAAGKKISGNAFYHRKDRSFHHGTILFNTDFAKMVEYLNVDQDKIKAKGIKSIRSRVINLQELAPELTIECLIEALQRAFIEEYTGPMAEYQQLAETDLAEEELARLEQKYAGWEFRYGESPSYDLQLKQRFCWGKVELALDIKRGSIVQAQIFSDAMDHKLSSRWQSLLVGAELSRLGSLLGVEQPEDVDIKQWLLTEFRL